ncbi:MAG: hypothetical protein Q9204_000768 [Flavoplaca sp. TL-2023a]
MNTYFTAQSRQSVYDAFAIITRVGPPPTFGTFAKDALAPTSISMKTRISKAANFPQADPLRGPNEFVCEQDRVKLMLLPQTAGPDSLICTLAHPSTSKANRYYWCPKEGLCEFKKIAASKRACRSWLLGSESPNSSYLTAAREPDGHNSQSGSQPSTERVSPPIRPCILPSVEAETKAPSTATFGHTVREADISIATSIDVLFFALPSLHNQISTSAKALFLSIDDLFEPELEKSNHLKHLLLQESLRRSLEPRIAAVCDSVDAGEEKMYRLNMDKLVLELVAKARRMLSNGLPASMEAKFVNKVLETPMTNIIREEGPILPIATETSTETGSLSTSAGQSQTCLATSESVESDSLNQTNMIVPDEPPPPTPLDDIKDLLRLRTALSFIMSSYLCPSLATAILTVIQSQSSPINFKPIDVHLAYLGRLRAEALASRSLSNISRKRNIVDDDEEAAEAKAEKRRKKEDEEKRQKVGLTKGVRDLKKVDVTGMKKMSDFFGKKPAQGKTHSPSASNHRLR